MATVFINSDVSLPSSVSVTNNLDEENAKIIANAPTVNPTRLGTIEIAAELMSNFLDARKNNTTPNTMDKWTGGDDKKPRHPPYSAQYRLISPT
ncbi:MAG: hypothetical protein ABSC25_03200 [Roseiarcus sp.]